MQYNPGPKPSAGGSWTRLPRVRFRCLPPTSLVSTTISTMTACHHQASLTPMPHILVMALRLAVPLKTRPGSFPSLR